MKLLSILALLLPFSPAWADEKSDRAAIEKTITALNDPAADPSSVWAPGVDHQAERAKLTGGPLSEIGGGRVVVGSIQFPAHRTTAQVHATQTQFGSLLGSRAIGSRTVAVLIMMKKVRGGWRITEIRPGQ